MSLAYIWHHFVSIILFCSVLFFVSFSFVLFSCWFIVISKIIYILYEDIYLFYSVGKWSIKYILREREIEREREREFITYCYATEVGFLLILYMSPLNINLYYLIAFTNINRIIFLLLYFDWILMICKIARFNYTRWHYC